MDDLYSGWRSLPQVAVVPAADGDGRIRSLVEIVRANDSALCSPQFIVLLLWEVRSQKLYGAWSVVRTNWPAFERTE